MQKSIVLFIFANVTYKGWIMENSDQKGYSVGVLVVSDTVFHGEKVDSSGKNLANVLKSQKYFKLLELFEACVPDERQQIEMHLKYWTDEKHVDLILTTGGTGFSPRDVTPEATRAIIEKEAPHIASYMVISCCEKTKFAVLSRGVCGIRGSSLILNLPGSSKGSGESFEAIASVLPHAMDQLKQNVSNIVADHVKIQEVQREAFNMTEPFPLRYPIANMIFPNKTVILVTSKHHNTISTNQQMALLAAMAFIGGIVVGLLFRFIYFGIVNYFVKNMDQITPVQRPNQGNTNVAYVDDNFRPPHDEPPDYVTVVTTESSTNTFRVMNKTAESKDTEDGPPPPTYISIVSNVGRVVRSAST